MSSRAMLSLRDFYREYVTDKRDLRGIALSVGGLARDNQVVAREARNPATRQGRCLLVPPKNPAQPSQARNHEHRTRAAHDRGLARRLQPRATAQVAGLEHSGQRRASRSFPSREAHWADHFVWRGIRNYVTDQSETLRFLAAGWPGKGDTLTLSKRIAY